ncbi:MAG TPA: histidine kinase [Cellulomonas sp.]
MSDLSDVRSTGPEDEPVPTVTPAEPTPTTVEAPASPRPAADLAAEAGPPTQTEPAPPIEAAPTPPTEAELAAVAEPARVRRAPKIGAFITAGALIGALVGLVATAAAGTDVTDVAEGTAFISFLEGQGTIRLLMVASGAVVGALVGGLLAVLADRRSGRGTGLRG